LVVITPACGFVDVSGSVIIGLCAGVIPFFFVTKVKGWLGYDDALDTFGVHAVGGTMGALLTGFLATDKVNGNLSLIADAASANPATKNGLAKLVANGGLWIEQVKAIGVTLAMAIIGTIVIAYIVKATIGLRVSEEVETIGLDLAEHGEEGYHG
ncbi:MAG: ammonium transporter, partial [Limisphaerales bacterium]